MPDRAHEVLAFVLKLSGKSPGLLINFEYQKDSSKQFVEWHRLEEKQLTTKARYNVAPPWS